MEFGFYTHVNGSNVRLQTATSITESYCELFHSTLVELILSNNNNFPVALLKLGEQYLILKRKLVFLRQRVGEVGCRSAFERIGLMHPVSYRIGAARSLRSQVER